MIREEEGLGVLGSSEILADLFAASATSEASAASAAAAAAASINQKILLMDSGQLFNESIKKHGHKLQSCSARFLYRKGKAASALARANVDAAARAYRRRCHRHRRRSLSLQPPTTVYRTAKRIQLLITRVFRRLDIW
uniref:Uncharacterized protein n=1 Tax=Syphacia muris TaxID=451379 RepID=A0A0N5ATC3_9BILA